MEVLFSIVSGLVTISGSSGKSELLPGVLMLVLVARRALRA